MPKTFTSINPYNGSEIATYVEFDDEKVYSVLQRAQATFEAWRSTPFRTRTELLKTAADVLSKNKGSYAEMASLEMGKPLKEAIAEVEKCVWACRYYAENAPEFLRQEIIETEASSSYIRYEPLGAVLAIMPWNFPYWQVFRFAAPAVMAGNVGLLKHAPNVFGCALIIEEVFEKAGFPKGVFQNLLVDHDKIEGIINDEIIKAVTLTGSERAGSVVASLAGKAIKKTVLELGGSNAFIVLDDADLEAAVITGVKARMQNSGQSCIAGKRFIVHEKVAGEYIERFRQKVLELQPGDPKEDQTTIGPLARQDLAEKLEEQVQQSLDQGARLLIGGNRDNAYFEPTILTDVKPGMPAFDEELFGPVASFTTVNDDNEAVRLANKSSFGLGVTLFSQDMKRVKQLIPQFDDGAVFVNEMVKSDPRLPFGGTKRSGYGRELSAHGIREFVNVKTVFVQEISR